MKIKVTYSEANVPLLVRVCLFVITGIVYELCVFLYKKDFVLLLGCILLFMVTAVHADRIRLIRRVWAGQAVIRNVCLTFEIRAVRMLMWHTALKRLSHQTWASYICTICTHGNLYSTCQKHIYLKTEFPFCQRCRCYFQSQWVHTLCMRACTGHVYLLRIFILDLSAKFPPISFHLKGWVVC